MFWKGKEAKASELIRHHLNGTGTGYELDDLVSVGRTEFEDISGEIGEISVRYATREYPVGISNPAAFPELTALAERLEAEGR